MADKYKVIGLMSGTSLDGLDIAFCHIEKGEIWQFEIVDTETVEYPEHIIKKLLDATLLSGEELVKLDLELGKLYGELVSDFINRYDIKPDFISSHGHTLYHQPDLNLTYQAGNGKCIALATQLPVICDFRSMDLLMGGQGAPLVPIGDLLLFSEYSACINLGGIANISFDDKGKRIAYDISPANMPLNILVAKMGYKYDEGGKIAASGNVDEEVLNALNSLEYYSENGPKSLGYEWVTQNIIPQLEKSHLSIPDQLRTLVEHTASVITNELFANAIEGRVLFTGGGSLNTFLMNRITELKPDGVTIDIPDEQLIIYKEALIFAFMGVLKIRSEFNVLSSVTGASTDHIAGTMI